MDDAADRNRIDDNSNGNSCGVLTGGSASIRTLQMFGDAGTASLYQLTKYDILGSTEVPRKNYDLISVIMLQINDKAEVTDATMRLLQTLCSKRTGKQQKIDALKGSGICADGSLEGGIDDMCNLSDAIYRDGIQAGIQAGSQKTNIRNICRMFANGMPVGHIAQCLDIDEETVQQVIELAGEDVSCDDGNIERIYRAIS